MSLGLEKVTVDQLRVGMYVTRLDCDWLDTPFLMQGFHIELSSDIEVVSRYCEYVWVDFRRSGNVNIATADPSASSFGVSYVNKSSFNQEFKRTVPVFKKARILTKSLLEEIQLGGSIDHQQIKDTVGDCVQSVIRHPDALTWMSKMRSESEYTADHCLNVCILAIAFGRQLGLPELELQRLGLCGLLHDVGKMKTPDEILNSPDKLTAKEMKIMRAHTTHGRNLLLNTSDVYSGVIDVAYSHHERADGHGYPRNLSNASISQYARVISIVDAYDAMTADRCYQSAKTTTEALKIIYEERGKQFDEKLALKFLETVGLYPVGSIVELVNGQVAVVVEGNVRFRQLPRVIILRDGRKSTIKIPKMVDLSLAATGELSNDYLIKQVHKDKAFGISLRDFQGDFWLNSMDH